MADRRRLRMREHPVRRVNENEEPMNRLANNLALREQQFLEEQRREHERLQREHHRYIRQKLLNSRVFNRNK